MERYNLESFLLSKNLRKFRYPGEIYNLKYLVVLDNSLNLYEDSTTDGLNIIERDLQTQFCCKDTDQYRVEYRYRTKYRYLGSGRFEFISLKNERDFMLARKEDVFITPTGFINHLFYSTNKKRLRRHLPQLYKTG